MSYQQNEKTQPCKDCANNNVLTNIVWRNNPDKPGINPNTGRPYMMPVDVKTGQRHNCQFFKQRQSNQTNQALDARQTPTTTRPQFTPNDKTVENIETHLARLVTLTEEMRDFMEIMVRDTKVKPASDHNIPEEHKEYQNNTAYTEDNTEVSSERYAGEHDKW